MKKCLLMTAIMVTSLITLNACCTVVPGRIIYSDGITAAIEDTAVKAAVLVTADGQLLFYDEKGNPIADKTCKIPKPTERPENEQLAARQAKKDYPKDVCTGLTTESAITGIQTVSILKSNSQNCVILAYDHNGDPIQRCW